MEEKGLKGGFQMAQQTGIANALENAGEEAMMDLNANGSYLMRLFWRC